VTAPGTSSLAALRRDDAAWDAFVASSGTPTYLQTVAWARSKVSSGWRAVRVVADGGSGPIGAQVLVRRIGPGPFALGYAARGPIATRFDATSLDAFAVELRRMARRQRLTHVTADPAVESVAGIESLFAAGRWRRAEPVQYEETQVIDLTRSEADLWADLRSTTRRYVNKARRDGCTVRDGSAADLPTFYEILVATARRGGFVHRSMDTYVHIYELFAASGDARLLVAELPDGTPAAVKILLSCDGRVAQPYSGMTEAGAATRANYLLEWETISRSAAAGLREYDMSGLATPGITYFKQGFGGRRVDYVGTWDLVMLPFLRDALVRARRAYVWFARRRHGLAPADGGEKAASDAGDEADGGAPDTAGTTA